MITQTLIAILGIASIWLVNDPRASYQRWACILGLIAQPFWFYASWQADQWGIFLLSIAYAMAWLRGFNQHWITAPHDEQARRKRNAQFTHRPTK